MRQLRVRRGLGHLGQNSSQGFAHVSPAAGSLIRLTQAPQGGLVRGIVCDHLLKQVRRPVEVALFHLEPGDLASARSPLLGLDHDVRYPARGFDGSTQGALGPLGGHRLLQQGHLLGAVGLNPGHRLFVSFAGCPDVAQGQV